jgi:putative DNA primase/helicase
MDAGVEQPETRPIPRDGVAHALKQRPAAIRAMLTITRAYLTAGSPDVGVAPYGSFETWDALVRRPLVWAMRRDPLETARAVRAGDHEFGAVADLCAAWLEKYGSEPVSAAQIVADAKASYPRMDGGYDQTNPALAAVVGAVLGDLSRNGARELEYRLRAWHGRIVCGRRILKAGQGNESRAVLWKVV